MTLLKETKSPLHSAVYVLLNYCFNYFPQTITYPEDRANLLVIPVLKSNFSPRDYTSARPLFAVHLRESFEKLKKTTNDCLVARKPNLFLSKYTISAVTQVFPTV